MIVQYNQPGFDPDWLRLVQNDPVHPGLAPEKRVEGPRTLFAYVVDGKPLYLISAFIGTTLARTLADIIGAERPPFSNGLQHMCAIFYSIFRLADTVKGKGQQVIYEAIDYCKKQGVAEFFTLSPVPSLSRGFSVRPDLQSVASYLNSRQDAVARFHLDNGAELYSINYQADGSPVRQQESWGIMVNYHYPDALPNSSAQTSPTP